MTAPDEEEILAMEDAGPEVVGLPGRFTLNVHAEDAYEVDEVGAKRAFTNDPHGDAFVFEDEDTLSPPFDRLSRASFEEAASLEAASLEVTERVVRTSTAGARQRTMAPRPATVAWGATFMGLAALAGAVVVLALLIGVFRWVSAPEPVVEAPPPVVEPVVPVVAAPEPVVEPEPEPVVEPEPEPVVAKAAPKPRRAPKPAAEPEPTAVAEPAPVVEAPPPPPVAEPEPEEKKKGLFRKKKD